MPNPFQLGKQPLIAFVPTTDPPAARRFYAETLGLRCVSDELPFALVFDAHGTMLRVTAVQSLTPAPYTVLGWEVADIAEAIKALRESGVHFEHFPGLPQDELGVWSAPGGAKVAWFKDPGGNTLSLSHHPRP